MKIHGVLSIAIVASGLLPPAQAGQTETRAWDRLPEGAVAWLEIPKPGDLVGSILDSDLWLRLEASPLLQSPDVKAQRLQLETVLRLFETNAGLEAETILEKAGAGGIAAGLYLRPEGQPELLVVVLFDEDGVARDVGEALIRVTSLSGTNIERRDVEGYEAARLGPNAFVAWKGKELLLSSGREAIRAAVERSEMTRPESPDWIERARDLVSQSLPVRLFGNLEVLSQAATRGFERLVSGRTGNALASLLLGGIGPSLRKAKALALGIDLGGSPLRLEAAWPVDPGEIGAAFDFYFTKRQAKPPVRLPDQPLATLQGRRDLGAWWAQREELLDERLIPGLVEFNTTMDLFFSGLDFGREVLPKLGPEFQIVLVRQSFDRDVEARLPAGALILPIEGEESVGESFFVAFQTAIGFVNLNRGQEKLPPLSVRTKTFRGVEYATASYRPGDEEGALPMRFNVSPSITIVEGRLVLSSTEALLQTLMADLLDRRLASLPDHLLLETRLDAHEIAAALEENRGALIAQNMLEKGHSPAEAEKEIGGLIEVVKLFEEGRASLARTQGTMRIEIEIRPEGEGR